LAYGCPEEHGRAAEEGGGHFNFAKENPEDNDVERYAEDVVDGASLALRDDHSLDSPNRREVEADASLKDKEPDEDESVVAGEDRDEEARAGNAEGVLGDFLDGDLLGHNGEDSTVMNEARDGGVSARSEATSYQHLL